MDYLQGSLQTAARCGPMLRCLCWDCGTMHCCDGHSSVTCSMHQNISALQSAACPGFTRGKTIWTLLLQFFRTPCQHWPYRIVLKTREFAGIRSEACINWDNMLNFPVYTLPSYCTLQHSITQRLALNEPLSVVELLSAFGKETFEEFEIWYVMSRIMLLHRIITNYVINPEQLIKEKLYLRNIEENIFSANVLLLFPVNF